jgi:hypothetical protein
MRPAAATTPHPAGKAPHLVALHPDAKLRKGDSASLISDGPLALNLGGHLRRSLPCVHLSLALYPFEVFALDEVKRRYCYRAIQIFA